MNLKLFFLLILSLLLGYVQAQSPAERGCKRGLTLEVNGFAGKQVKIYPNYPDNKITGFAEVHAGYKCYGNKAWHGAWKYPQIGISFIYGYLGNKEILGYNYGLIPGITFESRDDRKFPVDVRLGTGLAWFSKPYNRISNPENMVIGSHLTDITYASVNYRRILNHYFSLWTGISFFHFSNGHYQLPNVGLNTFALNAGIIINPYGRPAIVKTEGEEPSPDRRVKMNLRVGFGMNEFGSATKPIGGPRYPVYVVSTYAAKRIGKINNLHAGLCMTYYSGFYDYIIDQEYYESQQRIKSCVISAFIGDELIIGRFGLVGQSGINLYNPFQREYFKMNYGSGTTTKLKTWWCNKIGVQIYLLNPERRKRFNLWLGAYIKSNLMTADFVENAIGVTL